jgi:hypothetical protein
MQLTMPEPRPATRASRLRTAQDPSDPDTVWIGHIYDPTFTAGGTMPAGGYGPYHVGRGPNRPTRSGGTIGSNGTWDFDRFQLLEQDSLQGWWPMVRCFQSGATTFPDYRRAFYARRPRQPDQLRHQPGLPAHLRRDGPLALTAATPATGSRT